MHIALTEPAKGVLPLYYGADSNDLNMLDPIHALGWAQVAGQFPTQS
jgi:hypothetical protein